jgi:orc1/cdc6 family replication initiation protein
MVERVLIRRPEVLTEAFMPSALLGRDRQIEELRMCLAPSLKQRKPINAWLCGSPGTGKTAVARHVLESIAEEHPVRGVYINCWEYRTLYLVSDKIVREQRIMFAEKTEAALKLERFARSLGSKPFVIVLDEIDKPTPVERNAILYNLSSIGNVGLICICNSRYFLVSLDQRILSRLAARQIVFQPYTSQQLVEILKDRAEEALEKDAWSVETLVEIARLSEGDARVAIQTLKNAAELAEARRGAAISPEDIGNGFSVAKELKLHYLLKSLTEHHRLIYELIKEAGTSGILSNALWESYLQRCSQSGKRPVAMRTFSSYVSTLLSVGLVQDERAPVRGNLRLLKASWLQPFVNRHERG